MKDYLSDLLLGFQFEAREIKNVLFLFLPDATDEQVERLKAEFDKHLNNHFEKTVVMCGVNADSIRIADEVDING